MTSHWWRRLASVRKQSRATRPKLGLEYLEARDVPAVSLVSVAASGASASANGLSTATPLGSISADGRYVVFLSDATNLVADQVDSTGTDDVFIRDTQTGQTKLISKQAGTTATTGDDTSYMPTISGDGKWVAFTSQATNLVAGVSVTPSTPLNAHSQVYLYDVMNSVLSLVTYQAGSTTVASDDNITSATATPSLSHDGRYLAFISGALNLISGQGTTGDLGTSIDFPVGDAFLYDRLAPAGQQLSLVSHIPGNNLLGGNDLTTLVTVSGSGNKVSFTSVSRNLVANQSESNESISRDIFVYDVATRVVSLVTRSVADGTAAASVSDQDFLPQSISADGRYIVYASRSTTLVSGVTDGASSYDLFLYDTQSNTNTLITKVGNTAVGGAYTLAGDRPVISADGAYVAFTSSGANLVPGVTGTNVYLYATSGGAITLVSHTAGSLTTGATGRTPSISADGRYVAYVSTTATRDTYRFDRTDGSLALFSSVLGSDTTPSGGVGTVPSISGNGATIAWNSTASNMVANDTNAKQDVFINTIDPDGGDDPDADQPTTDITQTQAPDVPGVTFAQFTTSDTANPYMYQFEPGGTGNPYFVIVENPNQPGQFFIQTGPNFPGFGQQSSFTITVRTTGTGPNNQDVTYTTQFTVTSYHLQVTFTQPVGAGQNPGQPQMEVPGLPNIAFALAQSVVQGLPGGTFTISLAPGQGNNNQFTISNGQISTGPTFGTAPTQPAYTIVIQVTDDDFPAQVIDVPFTITLVPQVTDLDISSTIVNAADGAIVGAVTVTGQSAAAVEGRDLIYTLVSGVGDDALFTIANGVVTTGPNFPTGTAGSYTVVVRVTDPAFPQLAYTESFTIQSVVAPQPPTLTVPSTLQLAEGTPQAFVIVATAVSAGSDVTTIRITGVPAGVTFSAGTKNSDGSWTLTPADLAGLTITVPDDIPPFVLTVVATAAYPNNPNVATATQTTTVTTANVPPTVVVKGPTGPIDPLSGLTAISVTVTDPGADTVSQVTINWGDGIIETVALAAQYTHQYALANRAYAIQVSVTDEDGTFVPAAGGPAVDARLATKSLGTVSDMYLDILGRGADASGLRNFAALLDAGTTAAQVATALMSSPEYRTKLINDLYRRYLGRDVDASGLASGLALFQALGNDAGSRQLAANLLSSGEYAATSGSGNDEFLRALYLDVLDREIDDTGLAGYLAALGRGVSRADVARAVLASAEAVRLTVEDLYQSLLGRAADPSGLQSGSQLAAGGSTNLVLAIVGSPEYAARANA